MVISTCCYDHAVDRNAESKSQIPCLGLTPLPLASHNGKRRKDGPGSLAEHREGGTSVARPRAQTLALLRFTSPKARAEGSIWVVRKDGKLCGLRGLCVRLNGVGLRPRQP